MSKDKTFTRFSTALILLLVFYGIGMFAVGIWGTDDELASRFVTGFASMFTGVLGLGSGYLLGRNEGKDGDEKDEA